MASIYKYSDGPQLTWTAKQRLNIPEYHLKHWDKLVNLTAGNKEALCTCPSLYPSSPLAGKNGTYNKPAPIYLGFGNFDLPNGTVVEKAILHYAHRVYAYEKDVPNPSSVKDYPSIAAPTISFYSDNSEVGKITLPSAKGDAPPIYYKYFTKTFTGITTDIVNSDGFGIIIAYPSNTNTSPGRLGLKDVYLELVTRTANVTVGLKSNTSKISKGGKINVTCTVQQNDNLNYNPRLRITLSSGLSFVRKSAGSGTIDTSDGIVWTTVLDKNKKSSSVIELQAKSIGTQSITITDIDTQQSYTIKVGVTETEVTVTSNIVKVLGNRAAKVGETVSYTITANTTNTSVTAMQLEIHLPACAEIENIATLQSTYGIKSGTVTKVGDVTINKGSTATLNVKVSTENKANATGTITALVSDKSYALLSSTASEKILTINAPIINNKGDIAPIPMKVTFNDAGVFSQIIKYLGKVANTTTFTIKPKTYTDLAFTRIKIPLEVTTAMGHSKYYKAFSRVRFVPNSTSAKYTIDDLKRNLRFGVYHASSKLDVNDESTFLENCTFAKNIVTGNFVDYAVSFLYNANNPLYFVWTHEYLQSQNFDILNVEFYQPQLIESGYYSTYEEGAVFPKPLPALLGNTQWGKVTLPANTPTNKVVLWRWNDGGSLADLTNMIVQGLQVSWDYITDKEVELQIWVSVNIYDNTGSYVTRKGYRNIQLTPSSKEQHNAIGGEWDSYGLRASELYNIQNMSVSLIINNTNTSKANIQLQNVLVAVHTMKRQTQQYSFRVDGEKAEDYGIFLTEDFDWDFGTKNEVKYYNTSGTDIHTAYRMNIDKKELSFKFILGDCDLEESTHLLDKIATLFTNKRTIYNKPIEKELVFDHMPEYSFWFIRESALETKIEHGQYTVTVKLTIPSGTRRKRARTITGSHGSNPGVAKVQPTLSVTATKDTTITIIETNTKQKITIDTTSNKQTDSKIKKGDILIIDSENRKVTLYKSGTNTGKGITGSVDYSSTWFSVQGEYAFTSQDCYISHVKFYERGG